MTSLHGRTFESMFLAAFLAAGLVVGPACSVGRAQVVYSTFGPGDSFHAQYYDGVSGPPPNNSGRTAARFVSGVSGTFNRVEVGMSDGSGNGPLVTITVSPDSGGSPGSGSIWTGSGTIAGRSIYTITGPTASVVAGQAYWVIVGSTDNSYWYFSDPAVSGTAAGGTDSWNVFANQQLPAFRVSLGGIGACCNTRSGACAALESSVCASVGLRFDGAASTCTATSCRACPADFDGSGRVTVQDIFDFLSAWFAGCP